MISHPNMLEIQILLWTSHKNNELVRTGMDVNEHERLSTLHLDINKSKGKGVCINI